MGIRFRAFLVLVLFFTACKSRYERIKSGNNNELKYKTAAYYFNKRDFTKALPLLEDLSISMKGSVKAENANYYYAYCEYYLKDFQISRSLFKTFAENFPNSTHAEEARYMSAKSSYQESAPHTLDQEYTYKAIEALQLFVNLYPHSKRIPDCNRIIDVLRNKLEAKSFENAKLYYDIGYYKPAIISLKNSIRDYPDSKYREETEYLILKSNFLYARNSIPSKKEERFNDVILSYQSFQENFPKSAFSKDATRIESDSKKAIQKIKKEAEQQLAALKNNK